MKFYFLKIDDISEKDIELVKNIFPNRYQKSQNYKNRKEFLQCIGSYILLFKAIPNIREEEIYFNKNGKPLYDKVCFSYSHDDEMIVLAVSNYAVGIDVVDTTRSPIIQLDKIFNNNEIYLSREKVLNFHIIWAIKESVIKLFGDNLSSLKSIDTIKENALLCFDNKTVYNHIYKFEKYIISISSLNKFSIQNSNLKLLSD